MKATYQQTLIMPYPKVLDFQERSLLNAAHNKQSSLLPGPDQNAFWDQRALSDLKYKIVLAMNSSCNKFFFTMLEKIITIINNGFKLFSLRIVKGRQLLFPYYIMLFMSLWLNGRKYIHIIEYFNLEINLYNFDSNMQR